ncbi:MAG: hypothetical protein ACI9FN_002457, partial [Saprospiraceae bacterium]
MQADSSYKRNNSETTSSRGFFNEEHDLFRQSLRDFMDKEVKPYIDKWEKMVRYLARYMKNLGP